jgi:TRAP-type C4-dicarboxylate transport system permease small subunit
MAATLERINAVIDGVSNAGAVLGGICTGVMTATITYAVVVRYILRQPVGWSEEFSNYLMVWAVFLGASYALKEDAHIGVDLLLSNLRPRIKSFFLLFHYVAGLVFCSLLLWKGVELVRYSIDLNNRSIAINFPLFIPQLAVPVGSAMLILQLFAQAFKLIPRFRGKIEGV